MLGLFPEENVSTDLDLAGGGGGLQPCVFFLLPRRGRNRRVPWHLLRLNRYRKGAGGLKHMVPCQLQIWRLVTRAAIAGQTSQIWADRWQDLAQVARWSVSGGQVIFQVIGWSLIRW